MPKRTARPRTRRRNLEGVERLSALAHVGCAPTIRSDPGAQRAECRRTAELWLELRDDVLADEPDGSHWAYVALELRRDPSHDHDVRSLLAEASEEWIADARLEQAELARMACEEFDQLTQRQEGA